MAKRILSNLLCVLFIGALTTTTAFAATDIETIAVDNVPVPVDGDKPVYSVQVASPQYGFVDYDEDVWLNGISWSEYDGDWEYIKDMTPDSTFVKGNIYVCYVKLQATFGYAFTSNTTVKYNGNVNGNTQSKSGDGSTITAYAAFEALDSITDIDITVVKPVIGKTPTFAKVDTDKYESKNNDPKPTNQTNGVVWTNEGTDVNITVSNPFKADTTYSVTYSLFAKEGYGFSTAVVAKINGKDATVKKESGYITVKLGGIKSGTGETEIETLDLTIVTPIEGEKPTYEKVETDGYYSDSASNSLTFYKNGIAWFKSETSAIAVGSEETFEAEKEYTVKFVLTAKEGYIFAKTPVAKINGAEATVDAIDEYNIIVEAKLTAQKKHIHTESDWQKDEKDHWKDCTECKENTVAKEAHKDENKDNLCDVCSYKIPSTEEPIVEEPIVEETPVVKVKKPAKVKGVKVKSGKKKLTVTWKKAKNAKKYTIKYSYKKNMKGAKTKTVKAVKVVIKKLKSGKKVYVQVCGVNGKIKGKFSKKIAKKVK